MGKAGYNKIESLVLSAPSLLAAIFCWQSVKPLELMQRAKRIVFHSSTSPEMDDEAIQLLMKTSRNLEDEGEEVVL